MGVFNIGASKQAPPQQPTPQNLQCTAFASSSPPLVLSKKTRQKGCYQSAKELHGWRGSAGVGRAHSPWVMGQSWVPT